jgi:hypothetical protein
MGEPITVETCEICQQPFNLPMKKYRRMGGFRTGDGTFVAYYEGDELDDLSLTMVCPNCASSIANVARVEINRLRPQKTTRTEGQ